MKHKLFWVICIILVGLTSCYTTKAEVKKEGNTYITTSSTGNKSDDIKTDYLWKDSSGNSYTIYIHQYTKGDKAGKYGAYVLRVSKQTGKEYKYYIPQSDEIAIEIMESLKKN